ASAFYMDTSGLGLVTTIVTPVVAGGVTKGIVGLDVTLLDLIEDLIFDRDFKGGYPFIVDSAGQAIWHPSLPNPVEGSVEPTNIADIEITPEFATDVMPGLVAGETGSATIYVSMPIARGDATYAGFATDYTQVTFAWQPVAGTPFRLCVALTVEDQTGKKLASPPGDECNDKCSVYHRLDFTGARCDHSVTEKPGGIKIIEGISSNFFAASAFESSAAWLEFEEGDKEVSQFARASTCSGGTIPYFGSGVGSLKREAIDDNLLLMGEIDQCWVDRQTSSIVWSYFGSANGLKRMVPAGQDMKNYDPTLRPWYMGAVANSKGGGGYDITMSMPYLDSAGAGEILSVSKVVSMEGGSDDQVAGVMSVDMKLTEVERIVSGTSLCSDSSSTTCMIIDETGHIVYHPDFVDSPAADENIFLSLYAREVAQDLVGLNLLVQNTCMDYATGYKKTSYQLSSDAPGATGTLACGKWALEPLGSSNVYLLAVSSNGCERDSNVNCAVCSEENCNSWDTLNMDEALLCQPCQCKTKYDSCELKYGEGDNTAPACPAKPPQLQDLATNCYEGGGGDSDSSGGSLGSASRSVNAGLVLGTIAAVAAVLWL
ncbi:hypothetical protein TeGR_g15295, partial [Tetraparma gracilis]